MARARDVRIEIVPPTVATESVAVQPIVASPTVTPEASLNSEVIIQVSDLDVPYSAIDDSRKPWVKWESKGRRAWYGVAGGNALADGAETALGLLEAKRSIPEVATIAGLRVLQSLGLNGKASVAGFTKAVEVAKNRAWPPKWPTVSKKREGFTAIFAPIIGIVTGTTETVATYYFVTNIPNILKVDITNPAALICLKVAGGIVGGAKGANTLCAEGLKTYGTVHNAGYKTTQMSSWQKYAGGIIGYPLAAFGAMAEMVEAVGSTIIVFGLKESMPGKYGMLALSSCNGVGDFCLKGRETVKGFRAFIEYIENIRGLTIGIVTRDTVCFLVAGAAAGYVAFAQMGLIVSLLEEIAIMFSLKAAEEAAKETAEQVAEQAAASVTEVIVDAAITTIGYGTLIREAVLQSYVMNNLFKPVLCGIGSRIATGISNLCWGKPAVAYLSSIDDDSDDPDAEPVGETLVGSVGDEGEVNEPLNLTQPTYGTAGKPSQTGMFAVQPSATPVAPDTVIRVDADSDSDTSLDSTASRKSRTSIQ